MTGLDRVHDAPAGVGALAPSSSGGALLASYRGFFGFDPDSGSTEPVAPFGCHADELVNDGACDPAGRFWVGSYARDERPGGGSLYRLDPDRVLKRVLHSVSLSNGLGWSPDGTRMYYVDTATQRIDLLDYDLASGAIRGRRPLVRIPAAVGAPDGLAVDHDGCVWIALWGGGEVRRYTPAGRLDRVISLPVRHVTACAFGGNRGDTLFITSAADAGGPETETTEHAGGLFAVCVDVTGPPAPAFAG